MKPSSTFLGDPYDSQCCTHMLYNVTNDYIFLVIIICEYTYLLQMICLNHMYLYIITKSHTLNGTSSLIPLIFCLHVLACFLCTHWKTNRLWSSKVKAELNTSSVWNDLLIINFSEVCELGNNFDNINLTKPKQLVLCAKINVTLCFF